MATSSVAGARRTRARRSSPDQKPKGERRSTKQNGKRRTSNPIGLVLVRKVKITPEKKIWRMADLLESEGRGYKFEHKGTRSLKCLMEKDFHVREDGVVVHVYELPQGEAVSHLDVIDQFDLQRVESNPFVLDACLRIQSTIRQTEDQPLMYKRGRGDDGTNYFYIRNGEGLVPVQLEAGSERDWRIFGGSLYGYQERPVMIDRPCRVITCGPIKQCSA